MPPPPPSPSRGSSTRTASGSWSVPRPVRWAKALCGRNRWSVSLLRTRCTPAGRTSRCPGNWADSRSRRAFAKGADGRGPGTPSNRGPQPDAMNLLNASERGRWRCSTASVTAAGWVAPVASGGSAGRSTGPCGESVALVMGSSSHRPSAWPVRRREQESHDHRRALLNVDRERHRRPAAGRVRRADGPELSPARAARVPGQGPVEPAVEGSRHAGRRAAAARRRRPLAPARGPLRPGRAARPRPAPAAPDHPGRRAAAAAPRLRHARHDAPGSGWSSTATASGWRSRPCPACTRSGRWGRLLPPVMGSLLEHTAADGATTRVYVSGDTLTGAHLDEIARRHPDVDVAVVHLGGTRVLAHTVTMDGPMFGDFLRRVRPTPRGAGALRRLRRHVLRSGRRPRGRARGRVRRAPGRRTARGNGRTGPAEGRSTLGVPRRMGDIGMGTT